MLHLIHGIDGARNMVVYACPNKNRVVFENRGNCCTGTGHDEGYIDEFMLVNDGTEGSGDF